MIDLPYGVVAKLAFPFRGDALLRRTDTSRRRQRGLIIVLGGIEGPSFFNTQMVRGLVRARLRTAIHRFDWNDGIIFVRSAINLMSPRHHERQVTNVVEYVRAYRRDYPNAPISLLAQSGGCWIAIRVLEELAGEIEVSTCVLLAAAIAPSYDLSRAAGNCRKGLHSFRSAGDLFYLGIGTLLFGTSDRQHRCGAGLIGFRQPPANVFEYRWQPEWMWLGYVGNHTSSTVPRFVQGVVAPLLR